MATSYPVNSVSSNVTINMDLEIQEIMMKLKAALAKEEADTSKLMTELKAILSELKGMMASNSPITTDQISVINGQITALTSSFEQNENDTENTVNSLLNTACVKAGASPSQMKQVEKLSEEIQQKIVAEKKQFGDLVNGIESTLQTLKDAKGN